MKKLNSQVLWGVLLVFIGIAFLINNFTGIMDLLSVSVWAILFGIVGLVFLFGFISSRESWWAAIPGCTLLGIGSLIELDLLFPMISDIWGGTIVVGSIAIGFVLIYITQPQHWWALIPGGSLLTIAFMIGIGEAVSEDAIPSVFFFGLAATFGALYFLPMPAGQRQSWAIYPALGTLFMGLVLSALITPVARIVWPLAIIGIGIYLILQTTKKQNLKGDDTYEH